MGSTPITAIMTMDDKLQIKQAAAGCISGTLCEWPMLSRALDNLGYKLPKTTTARDLKLVCKTILEVKYGTRSKKR